MNQPEPHSQRWLFSAVADPLVFFGSSLASLLVVLLVTRHEGDTPPWAWLIFVLGIDVAHVWSTLFRVYLDSEELKRRPLLYVAAPVVALTLGVLAHSVSAGFFWRCLAYVAVWHFIRQQTGFMALYGRRLQSAERQMKIDSVAMLAATLGPVIWWHANLPRSFWWFHENDFVGGLPTQVGTVALVIDAALLGYWVINELVQLQFRAIRVGPLLLLLATHVTWFGGIVVAKDDFAFTVMNVVLHGVPYVVLVRRYTVGRLEEGGYGRWAKMLKLGLPLFIFALLALAFAEEFAWDQLVWHDHPMFFGESEGLLSDAMLMLVVPLLSLPQTTHYLLDGFVWKGRDNPYLSQRLGWGSPRS